jgi:hypothetical protein
MGGRRMIDKLIISTLKTLGVPVSRVFASGKKETFIFWQYITSLPGGHSDDGYELLEHTVRVHIFSKSDYTRLLEELITVVKAAGFTVFSIDSEIYEEETAYYHRPITINFLEE